MFAGSTDYGCASVSTTFSIAQATPTLTVTDAGGTYNGQPFPATVLVAGVVSGVDDTPSTSLEGVVPTLTYYAGNSASGPALGDAPTQAGTYTVVASFAGSPDYASASTTTGFTINQATPTVTVNDAGGASNGQSFPASVLVAGVVPGVDDTPSASLEWVTPTVQYQQLDGNGNVIAQLGSFAPSVAGSYAVVAYFAGSPDYTSSSATTLFTISPGTTTDLATPTVTVSANSGVYNGQAFTATALVAGTAGSPASSLEGVAPILDYQQLDSQGDAIAELGGNAPSQVGAYSVTAFFAGSTDYASAVATACFSITPAPLTITANDQDKTYGQTVTFAGTEFSATGLVNGDSINSVSISSTGAAATASVGSYAIEASNAVGSGLNNYAISYVCGTLAVTPASLTITASAVSGVYGKVRLNDSTGFSAVGLQNGETIGSVSLSSDATLSSSNNVNVGAWTITPGAAGGGTFTASNYAITYDTGSLTVTPRTLDIAAIGQDKVYDGSTAATVTLTDNRVTGDLFTDSYTTAVFTDPNVGVAKTVTVSGLAISGPDVGDYTILADPITTTANITQPGSTVTAGDTTVTDIANSTIGIDLNAVTVSSSGNPLTFTIEQQPANGTLVYDSTSGLYDYTPNVNYTGADSFTYLAKDGSQTSNVATVSITVIDPTPVADDEAYTVPPDQTTSLRWAIPGMPAATPSPLRLSSHPVTAAWFTIRPAEPTATRRRPVTWAAIRSLTW